LVGENLRAGGVVTGWAASASCSPTRRAAPGGGSPTAETAGIYDGEPDAARQDRLTGTQRLFSYTGLSTYS